MPSAEEAQRATQQKGRGSGLPKGSTLPKVLPEGMTNKRARAARTIKDHPEIVAKIKAQAREKLAKVGRPEIGTNVPVKSWNQYCHDIGIEKRTANRWLAGMIRYSRG